MELEKINKIINILNNSPIRAYLKKTNNVSIFENERIILNDIDRIVQINKENLRNPLKIVVLGEVKAGKSTLVNALIGKKVSYTNVVEATAAILEIRYYNEDKILINKIDGKNMELNSLNELDNLIYKNKNNQAFFGNINKISIQTNTDRLKKITLVDTPGLNTVTNENQKRTENYIANADVILWILNAHHLGQSDVVDKIEEVLDYGKPIICVLNRIDEINGDSDEIAEYVKNEMGYMFTEVFATSAKKAWDGYCENDLLKLEESNINELYEYILNNIEKNSDQVQIDSIIESIKMQIKKDLDTHIGTEFRIATMLQNFKKDIKELKDVNERIKDIISNKIIDWMDMRFFEEEKQLLIDCSKGDGFKVLVEKYTNEEYIQKVVNFKYEELQEYITEEWRNNTEEFIKRKCIDNIDLEESINLCNIMGMEDDNDIIDGIKQGGITAGAIGMGLAGYSAWLGPVASYVSIGSAVASFVPPLLIAGVLGGAVWKAVASDKAKNNRYNYVDKLCFEIKSVVKKNALKKMKENLYSISDFYLESSVNMITSILDQCNITSEELVEVKYEINRYITRIRSIGQDIIDINSVSKGILKRKEEYELKDKSKKGEIEGIDTEIVGVTVEEKVVNNKYVLPKLEDKLQPKSEIQYGVSYSTLKGKLPGLGFKCTKSNEYGAKYVYDCCGQVVIKESGAYFRLNKNTTEFVNATRNALNMLLPTVGERAYNLVIEGSDDSFSADGRKIEVKNCGKHIAVHIKG